MSDYAQMQERCRALEAENAELRAEVERLTEQTSPLPPGHPASAEQLVELTGDASSGHTQTDQAAGE